MRVAHPLFSCRSWTCFPAIFRRWLCATPRSGLCSGFTGFAASCPCTPTRPTSIDCGIRWIDVLSLISFFFLNVYGREGHKLAKNKTNNKNIAKKTTKTRKQTNKNNIMIAFLTIDQIKYHKIVIITPYPPPQPHHRK